jgi:hypothetical protein
MIIRTAKVKAFLISNTLWTKRRNGAGDEDAKEITHWISAGDFIYFIYFKIFF